MKTRILFVTILFALLSSVQTFAQKHATNCYYVEIYEVSSLVGKSVNLDFGKDAPGSMVYKIFDENDQNIEFKNVVAALNYMSSKGWELVSAFSKISGKAGTRTVYLMKYDAQKLPKDPIVKAVEETLNEYR